jgi:hypothetical protein
MLSSLHDDSDEILDPKISMNHLINYQTMIADSTMKLVRAKG